MESRNFFFGSFKNIIFIGVQPGAPFFFGVFAPCPSQALELQAQYADFQVNDPFAKVGEVCFKGNTTPWFF